MSIISESSQVDPPSSVSIIGTRGYPSFYGGFETAVRKLAPYLADQGWSVTVFGRHRIPTTDSAPHADPRINAVTTRGIETRSLSTLSYGLTATMRAIRLKSDVALVMNVANGYWLPLLKAANIPTLVNVDGIEWERAKWGGAARKAFLFGARMTAKYATELVFDAKAIKKRWKRDFQRGGTFIPYGGEAAPSLPLEAGLEAGRYVLMVARFVPENTISQFFDAVPAIASTATVVIVGSSGYGGEFDSRARLLSERYENVYWLGHLRDDARLLSLWQHAGAYFHGHSVGGTNPALVQAMACGAPIVARDTVYNREVLGDAGIFVDPTPESITTKTLELLADRDRTASLRERAKSRAQSNYSWDSVCARYDVALRRLLLAKQSKVLA